MEKDEPLNLIERQCDIKLDLNEQTFYGPLQSAKATKFIIFNSLYLYTIIAE